MAAVLSKPLARAIEIDGKPYKLNISPDGMKLVEKGRRKGVQLDWKDLMSGETALATALNASIAQMD